MEANRISRRFRRGGVRFRRLIFFEMRHAAAPAFKRAYIGQCAETLRPSNLAHVLSATWARRQLATRAFRIHDDARFNAIHALPHWLALLVEHSLATHHKSRWRTRPLQTSGHLPTPATSVKSVHAWVARSRGVLHFFLREGKSPSRGVAVNPAKCPNRSIPVSPCSRCVGPVGSFAYP